MPAAHEPEPELPSLMAAYQRGDARALEALLTSLAPGLYRFFLAQHATRDEAEDLVQETWLRLHRVRHTYRPGEPVLAWVYGIARHVRIDAYRRQQRRARHEVTVDTLPDSPAAAPPRGTHHDLKPCLDRLPQSQREVLTLLKTAGLSLEEVARATGATIGSVKQKAHRAYVTLRACLEESAHENLRGSPDVR